MTTVKELIAHLQEMPQDAQVMVLRDGKFEPIEYTALMIIRPGETRVYNNGELMIYNSGINGVYLQRSCNVLH